MFTQSAELYDLFYDWKDYAAEAARVDEVVRERLPGARSLLDVACGTGRHLEHLSRRYAVEGLDLDPGLLSVARRRLPQIPFHQADMTAFDLGRRFDAVVCLFSSIGYAETLDRLAAAVMAMARHVRPRGLLLVEPWLMPGSFDPQHLGRLLVVESEGMQAVRANASALDGRVSVLEFHYLVVRPGTVRHFTETHRLGLFTDEEYRSAFTAAGLKVDLDREGLMGRGLYIGQRPS